jgi:hypothetical protein
MANIKTKQEVTESATRPMMLVSGFFHFVGYHPNSVPFS